MLEINKIYNIDCVKGMKLLDDNSIDTIITDPPYDLINGKNGKGFMGKHWDSTGVAFNVDVWKEALRVCKPGAMLLAFGGTRTYHRMVCAIEDAGWEIRDCMMWMYGQGFPKSYDISKGIDKQQGNEREVIGEYQYPDGSGKRRVANCGSQTTIGRVSGSFDLTKPYSVEAQAWSGYGTALKPSYEPIVIAMKPIEGGYVNNALKYGVAGLNIDEGRIGENAGWSYPNGAGGVYSHKYQISNENIKNWNNFSTKEDNKPVEATKGRWPSNVILDKEAGQVLDEQTGVLKSGDNCFRTQTENGYHGGFNDIGIEQTSYGDMGGASRFFYCAKTSTFERNYGCEEFDTKKKSPLQVKENENGIADRLHEAVPKSNHHPTVKPISLMSYLARLTKMPSNGIVLDLFGGSGSTALGCIVEDRPYILFEKESEYITIAMHVLKHGKKQKKKIKYL